MYRKNESQRDVNIRQPRRLSAENQRMAGQRRRLVLAFLLASTSLCFGQTDSYFAAQETSRSGVKSAPETLGSSSGSRTGYVDAAASGVKCDGATDDTAKIQALLNLYAVGGAVAGTIQQIVFPTGVCRIRNELVYEGGSSAAVRISGQAGWSTSAPATQFAWYGPHFGTMMLILGCNSCSVENIDFVAAPAGGGEAQNGLWFDASNTVIPVTSTISTIRRTGNVVTVATTTAHAIAAGRIVKVAGADSFDGTFQVLYCNDNKHCSWAQTGSNESGNTGTISNYRSAASNGNTIKHVKVSNPRAASTPLISISSGASPYTLTAAAAHFVELGDIIIVRRQSDSSYDCAYTATGIPSSTTITATVLPGTTCSTSGAGSTGGTVLSGAVGIRFGHRDANTPQVSSISGDDLYVQGDQLGNSITAIQADNAGNTKNFTFHNVNLNGFRYGFSGFLSGSFSVFNYNGGTFSPDSSAQLAGVDFVNNGGQSLVFGAEVESTNDRFWVGTGASSSTHLDGISYQSRAPTDDIVINFSGSLVLTNSRFDDNRISTSAPYISCGNPEVSATQGCSLVSLGNFYANAAVGGAATAPGYIPFKDGSGNVFKPGAPVFLRNKQINITSIGDQGSTASLTGAGTQKPLLEVHPSLSTTSNCMSSASPAVCGSAITGMVTISPGSATVNVNTSPVTSNSEIFVQEDSSIGTPLSVTCNVTPGRTYTVTSRTAGTSFTITASAIPIANPACLAYRVIN